MPEIQAATSLQWADANAVQAAVRLQWGEGTSVQSVGSAYTPPPAPPGTPPSQIGSLAPGVDIVAQPSYGITHTLLLEDLRTDPPTALPVDKGAWRIDDLSSFWQFQASGKAELYAALRAGQQPPTVRVTANGRQWAFVIEAIDAPQAFASTTVTITGRSVAALADAPYQAPQQWTVDAPTTAAQLATIANTYSGLVVDWQCADWLIPAGAWSFNGSPFAVVLALASAAGAVVEAHPTELKVTVRSRYPVLPNKWATTPPDWQVHHRAVRTARYEQADTPEFNAIYVAGQQQGALLLARYAGTNGAVQAPMVTDPLLTDLPGLRERATAALAAFGKQSRVTRDMGFGTQGAVPRGALVRNVDPDETWTGLVRAVGVQATHGQVLQSITMERRTSFQAGLFVPPPPPVPTDPLFAQVVALLHFNEPPGSTTLVDSSSYGASVVLPGAGLEISNAAPKWGSASLLVNRRNGDPIVLTGSRFDRAAGQPFSIQWYAKKVATDNATNTPSYVQVINGGFGGTVFYVAQYYSPGITNVIQVFFSGFTNIVLPAGIEDAQGYVFYTLNVNASNILTLHANGTLVFTGASACGAWAGGGLYLGGPPGGVSGITTENYMDEFRFTIGATRDPSPPVAPFPDAGP